MNALNITAATLSMNRQSKSPLLFLVPLAALCFAPMAHAADPRDPDATVFGLRPKKDNPQEFGHIGPTGILAFIELDVKVTVTGTRKGSPADGKFENGEVIVAVNGTSLGDENPYLVLGKAITKAEAADGKMVFDLVSKKGPRKVVLQIPVLGAYSPTWPVNCKKSAKIIQDAATFYHKLLEEDQGMGIPGALPCLFLLSTGDDAHLPAIKKHYQGFIDNPKSIGGHTWNNGYNGIVCAEYYLRTGDKDMLPVLQAFCDDARDRQFFNAAWKHWDSDLNPNYVAGGLMNPASVSVLTTLLLSKEAGVNVDEKTLLSCLRYFYRFAGHGSVAYGDQRGEGGVASNGKDGMLAAAMQVASDAAGDTSIYQSARDSLSMATLDGYPDMVQGHGDKGRGDGIWRGIASSYLMEKKPERFREVRDKITWWYDLSRFDDGAMGMVGCQGFNVPTSGAAAAIAYTAPLKTLRVTGAPRSKYAKEFKLPTQIWGNQADLAFHRIDPAEGYDKFGPPMQIRPIVALIGSAYSKGRIEEDPSCVSLEQLNQFVRHNSYMIRTQAARAMRIKNEFGTLEGLLKDPDPRLRRAALDGIIDWGFWGGPHKKPLAANQFTPQMIESITAILNDPNEARYVVEGALFALGFMPPEPIIENFDVIMQWTKHDDWWLRHASFHALQGLQGDPSLYIKIVPTLTEMMTGENHTMPRTKMNGALSSSLKKFGSDSEIGKLLVKGFNQGVKETQILDGNRGREGKFNIAHAIEQAVDTAPDTAPQLAALLAERGLSLLEDDELTKLISGGKGFVGFLNLAAKMTGPARKNFEDVLYKSYRPEMAKRLKASGGKDIAKLDTLLGLMELGDADTGWQIIGSPLREERTWQYTTFHPTQEKDILNKREGRRFREVELPSGLKDWFKPEFDASKWQSGKAPIGKGSHFRDKKKIANRSVWGDGEFLLARTSFELKEKPDFDLYRLRILSIQGYQVYLNGRKIQQYGWWQTPDEIRKWPINSKDAALLKKGLNTLAVYTCEVYPSSQKPNWKGDVFGKFDCYIEGLDTKNLF